MTTVKAIIAVAALVGLTACETAMDDAMATHSDDAMMSSDDGMAHSDDAMMDDSMASSG